MHGTLSNSYKAHPQQYALCAPFGPDYPQLGAKVAKLRKGSDRKAHGAAVLDAIRAKQRAELQRELPSHNVSCASGTNHSDGVDILAAIARQHSSALQAHANKVRRARPAFEWEAMYSKAMAEKRKRKPAAMALAAS